MACDPKATFADIDSFDPDRVGFLTEDVVFRFGDGGTRVPGLASLVFPQQGFVGTMKQLQPAVTVEGDPAVDGAATRDYASWQRIVQQNPGALGPVEGCRGRGTSCRP